MPKQHVSKEFPQGFLEVLVPHAVDEGVHCYRHHHVQNCHGIFSTAATCSATARFSDPATGAGAAAGAGAGEAAGSIVGVGVAVGSVTGLGVAAGSVTKLIAVSIAA